MKSIIEWQTGEPTEFGFYLIVRKSRVNGNTRVDVNQWAKDELMKNGPLPKTCPQGWQMKSPDCCDIVAWIKLDDIQVEDKEQPKEISKMCINCENRQKEYDFFMPDTIICGNSSNQEGKNQY